MKREYRYKVVEGFTQSNEGDYHLIKYKFPESNDLTVRVKISNPRLSTWKESCTNIDWEKCLCYIAIKEGLEKQKDEIFLKEDVPPQQCPWANIKDNFIDDICLIESSNPPFGFHSRKK